MRRLYSDNSASESESGEMVLLAGWVDFEIRKEGMEVTGRISARIPHTMDVPPIFTREEPLQCVREVVLSSMGRGWVSVRFEGRRGGVCLRWAERRAEGEMMGIAAGGM